MPKSMILYHMYEYYVLFSIACVSIEAKRVSRNGNVKAP